MKQLQTFQTFQELNLPESLSRALTQMQFLQPTPIQAASIPPALEGKDILGTAQTGTGKTGAFGIPLIKLLHTDKRKQALVLAPTRELAAQIHSVLSEMADGSRFYGVLVVGGESFNRQRNEIDRGVDYIVATPGRLNDHLQEGTISLKNIGMLVLDEVDRMLDMGFAPQIKQIMRYLPQDRQTLLFSATLPKEVQYIAHTFLKDPIRVEVGAVAQIAPQIDEQTIETSHAAKDAVVQKELKAREGKVLIFARTKSRAERLARNLHLSGHKVVCLHGGRTQGQRKEALLRFRKGSHRIMVATDLAGRGIDIDDIEHVINYDAPQTREDYVHRIGRTARCGKTGKALNLLVPGDIEGELVYAGVKPKPRVVFSSRRFGRRR